jgi:hypothetical protein
MRYEITPEIAVEGGFTQVTLYVRNPSGHEVFVLEPHVAGLMVAALANSVAEIQLRNYNAIMEPLRLARAAKREASLMEG